MTSINRIVVINGNLCNADHWDDVVKALPFEITMIVPNICAATSMAEMAAIAEPYLDGQTALLGYSMGGYAAFETWRRHPEKIPALALLSTSARADDDKARDMRKVMIEKVHDGNFDKFVGNVIKLDIPEARWGDEMLVTRIRANCHDVGLDALRNHQHAMLNRPDSRADLPGITVPTLVVVGQQDIVTPPERAQEIADAIPGATLTKLQDCGHMPSLERPEELADCLCDWLQSL